MATLTLDTLAAVRANPKAFDIFCHFGVYLEKPEERHHHIYLIERTDRIDLVASDPSGGHFLQCHPNGHLVLATSEGRAAVVAASLTEFIELTLIHPYWQYLASRDLEAMTEAVEEEEETALDDQPELDEWREFLWAKFGLDEPTAPPNPLPSLHRALTQLSVGLTVRATTDPNHTYEPFIR
jgi:hypothetical protein